MGTSRSYDEDEDEEGEGEEEEEFRPVTDSSMLSELLVRAQQLMPYMQPIDYSQARYFLSHILLLFCNYFAKKTEFFFIFYNFF